MLAPERPVALGERWSVGGRILVPPRALQEGGVHGRQRLLGLRHPPLDSSRARHAVAGAQMQQRSASVLVIRRGLTVAGSVCEIAVHQVVQGPLADFGDKRHQSKDQQERNGSAPHQIVG